MPLSPSMFVADTGFIPTMLLSRENAAQCFFELMCLASTGKVNVAQQESYGDITVTLRSEEENDSTMAHA